MTGTQRICLGWGIKTDAAVLMAQLVSWGERTVLCEGNTRHTDLKTPGCVPLFGHHGIASVCM